MKAVYIKEFGGIENLEIRNIEDLPKPKGKQIIVKVKAAALNRADLLQRKGLYPPPKGFSSHIPGLEFAGEVVEIGENVTLFKIGQRVFGITPGEAQAEFVLTDEANLAEIPANLSFIEAAGVPEAFITAHDALFTQANLRADETCLIHAVGSGVGLAGLQLAKAHGVKVIGTSRTADKLERCKEYGLDFGIITTTGSLEKGNVAYLAEVVKIETQNQGVNVVLDLVGARYLQANLEALSLKGRLILVGTTSGNKAELNFGLVMAKRLKIFGTVLRSRSAEEKAAVTLAFVRDVVPLLKAGAVKPTIDRVFPVAEVQAAHEYLESNRSFGKVVLEFA